MHLFIVQEKMLWIDRKLNLILIGRLSNDHSVLEEAEETEIKFVGKFHSIHVAKIPQKKWQITNMNHLLPIRILYNTNESRVLVKPSKILYFSR